MTNQPTLTLAQFLLSRLPRGVASMIQIGPRWWPRWRRRSPEPRRGLVSMPGVPPPLGNYRPLDEAPIDYDG